MRRWLDVKMVAKGIERVGRSVHLTRIIVIQYTRTWCELQAPSTWLRRDATDAGWKRELCGDACVLWQL